MTHVTQTQYCMLASAFLLLAGVGFGAAAFITPPRGEVSDSVLLLIAQCFIMAGSFVGIDSILIYRIKQFQKGEPKK